MPAAADRARPLTEFCPLVCRRSTANVNLAARQGRRRAVGLVKFDFLGLTTLTSGLAERYVRRSATGFSLERVPLDDAETIGSCHRETPPQCSSWNRAACAIHQRARPDRFET